MKTNDLVRIVGLCAILAGCSALPSGGPTLHDMAQEPDVDLVKVTPQLAVSESQGIEQAEQANIERAIAQLHVPRTPQDVPLGAGAKMAVTLWSFSPRLTGSGPTATALGVFTVAPDGTIALPYAGRVRVDGMTVAQTEREVAGRLQQLGLFQKPSVAIDLTAAPRGQILVTGAVGEPKVILWPNQGLTLAEAISQSLGNGAVVLGQEDNSANHAIAKVSVLRGQSSSGELPVSVALERDIELQPGDRVVVKKSPAVRVTVLGPGMQANGVFDFEHRPTLSEVLARGAGLNPNSANNHAVFVLRERPGARPQLFDFAWDKGEGVVASHRFAMQSADLVYVAEAPMVAVQRVINILFQAAVPAQLAK